MSRYYHNSNRPLFSVVLFVRLSIYFLLGLLSFYVGILVRDRDRAKLKLSPCPSYGNKETIMENRLFEFPASSVLNVTLPKCRSLPHLKPKFEACGNKASSKMSLDILSNSKSKKMKGTDGTQIGLQPPVLENVFGAFRHPSHPMDSEIIISFADFNKERIIVDIGKYENCESVILTRTGSLEYMPNKCLAVAPLPGSVVNPIPVYKRIGKISGLVDRYSNDFLNSEGTRAEVLLLPLFLEHVSELLNQLRALVGDTVNSKGERRSIVVMVLNEGVIDLFLNYVCSLKAAGIGHILDDVVVFAGQESLVPLLTSMGVKAMFSPYLGPIPTKAAGFYGDLTFTMLMWLKTTSVYLTVSAGYNILFQDVDLVWLKDPLPMLRNMTEYDIIFMDDGARTPRFTPLYVNSGFYYVRHTPQSIYLLEQMIHAVSDVAAAHSHQSVLTRYVTETLDFCGLKFTILDMREFPSGYLYHHEKEYMANLRFKRFIPMLFHMCWTESRKEKVTYFKELGMWFLPEDNSTCYSADSMRSIIGASNTDHFYGKCCTIGNYWKNVSSVGK